jgi:hypothetical protein
MASYLYLLNMTGTNLYKIGISSRPWQRLEQVAGKDHAVKVVRVWPELASFEKRLHSLYSHRRVTEALEQLPVSGRTEWFRLTPEDVQAILAECHCERLQAQERDRIRQRVRCAE